MSDQPYAAPRDQSLAQPRPSRSVVRYEVLAQLTIAAALAYITRNAVGVAESSIREDLGMTLRQSGLFMGTFFWSYALLQVPCGWLAHQYGSRIAIFLFAMGWSVAALFIGLAPGLWLLLVAQLIMGAAQAGIFPASCLTVSHWMPVARRSLACGGLAMGMQVGAIAAGLLTGPLMLLIGWRMVFVAYAIPGFIWAAGFLIRFRDRPETDPRVSKAEQQLICGAPTTDDDKAEENGSATPPEYQAPPPTPWGAIFSSSAIWLLCGQQICRAAGYMFFASWFPTFLQETRGVTVKDAGYLQAMVFTGTLIGCLCGGLLTDWIWKKTGNLRLSRSGVGATFLASCAVLILAAWFVQNTVVAVTLLSLGAMFAALAGPCAFAATIDIGKEHVPQVFGLMNMMGNLAAAATPILVAELFERTANWTLVLLIFAAVYLIGAVCWAFVTFQMTLATEN